MILALALAVAVLALAIGAGWYLLHTLTSLEGRRVGCDARAILILSMSCVVWAVSMGVAAVSYAAQGDSPVRLLTFLLEIPGAVVIGLFGVLHVLALAVLSARNIRERMYNPRHGQRATQP